MKQIFNLNVLPTSETLFARKRLYNRKIPIYTETGRKWQEPHAVRPFPEGLWCDLSPALRLRPVPDKGALRALHTAKTEEHLKHKEEYPCNTERIETATS